MLYARTVSGNMMVKVVPRFEHGQLRAAHGPYLQAVGELHLAHREVASGRKVQLLELLGSTQPLPHLYEPRLIHLTDEQLFFMGYERAGGAWTLQQWECDLI